MIAVFRINAIEIIHVDVKDSTLYYEPRKAVQNHIIKRKFS